MPNSIFYNFFQQRPAEIEEFPYQEYSVSYERYIKKFNEYLITDC